ncbi:hypothetical protein Tco_0251679 [Tanacetum coccineum]
MTTLQFADTYNLVEFLSKPAESKGFEQIVTVKVKTVNGEVQLQALVDGKKIIVTEASVRRDLQLNDEEGTDCLPNATIFEELTRMGYEKLSQKLTFYKAFFSPQWKFLIHTILQCLSAKTTAWNEFSSTMASAIICLATNQKFNFSKYIFESMVKNLDNAGKGSANPTDPHHTPTIIQPSTSQPQKKQKPRKPKRKDTEVPQPSSPTDNVTDEAVYEEIDDSLERAATTATSLDAEQDRGNINKTQSKATLNEPSSLRTSSGSGPRRQETIGDTIAQIGFKNVSKTSNDSLLAGVNTPRSDEDSLKLKELMELFASKDVNLSVDEVTLAQALAALKSAKPKADKVKVQDKGKGIMVEEHLKMKKKYHISFDKQEAIRLQAEFDEEERLTKEKDEANVALTEKWNDIQAKFDANYQLAQRLQAQEQEELTDEEKARLPPTRAQQRSIMCTYSKNMEGWKPKSLKNKSFANIQELFDKAFKRVNTFVDYRTELMEESSKKAEVMEESSKKAKAEIAQESSSKREGEALE